MNKCQIITLFLVSALEGLIAAIFVFSIPSEAASAWLMGFSKSRIALGSSILLAVVSLVTIALILFIDKKQSYEIVEKINHYLDDQNNLLYVLIFLVTILVFIVFFIIAAYVPMGNVSPFALRAISLGFWVALMLMETMGLLVISRKEKINTPAFWNRDALKKGLLVSMLISLAFAHWMILIFRIPVFTRIQGWFWIFVFKTGYYRYDWLVLVILLAFILIASYYLKNNELTFWNLLPLVIFGALLQFGFAFIEGGSLETLRETYAKTAHSFYAQYAATGVGFIDTMMNYESLLGQGNFASTKPPGLIGLYILLEKLSFAINPSTLEYERFYRLTRLIAWIFPFLSTLLIYPLSSLGKRFLSTENAIIPALFYLTLPNVLLISLFMDQALYPFLFVMTIWLVVRAVDRSAFTYSIAAGLLLYLSIFISFSLIPAVFISFTFIVMRGLLAWTGITTCFEKETFTIKSLWRYLKLGLGILLGISVLYLLFQLLINYNFLERYANALSYHKGIQGYRTDLGNILHSILLSNSDYGVWTGSSVLLLALLAVWGSVKRTFSKSLTDFDWLSLSFLVTFILINFAGQTRSETGRLWMFLSPIIALFAAEQAPGIFRKREFGVYLVIVLQLITSVLTLKYQDFFG